MGNLPDAAVAPQMDLIGRVQAVLGTRTKPFPNTGRKLATTAVRDGTLVRGLRASALSRMI